MEGMEDKNDTAKESERDPDGMNERVREQLRSVVIPGELRGPAVRRKFRHATHSGTLFIPSDFEINA
jgi:hypothetical protein